MFNKKLLGERIKKVRGKKSQDIFASEIGISRGALSYYENGEREPDAEIIYRICELCNVSSDYLLGFTDNATTDTDLRAICEYTGLSQEAVETFNELKSSPNDDFYKIQSWIISYGFIETFAYILMALKDATQEYIEMEKEYKNDSMFSGVNINKSLDDVLRCDVYRYHLIKEAEKMANHFDQREQVQDNGKHNPPKE